MADHTYKLNDVPKGERWQYFKDYYLIKSIVILFIIVVAISIIKSTVFAPRPDVYILAVHAAPVTSETWDVVQTTLNTMPLDHNGDETVLTDFCSILLEENMEQADAEIYMANQNKLVATLSTAQYALQIVDETFYQIFAEMELLGTYAELPDAMGHNPEEIIKIPLKELAPFNTISNLPDGLYMTLRPRDAMQLGNSKKKNQQYENHIQTLLLMINQ